MEGKTRNVFVDVSNLEIGQFENDELNYGMKKIKIKFGLPKGSYATMLIKKLF